MLIAQKKKKENIAEYLLYMWQIEDLIRANKLDIKTIKETIIDKYNQPAETKDQITEWYENLIAMMKIEGVQEKGHLQINKNIIIDLTDLHLRLLKSNENLDYNESYYRTLPFIVELRTHNDDKSIPELETCFSALYGYLLLRIKQVEISGETQAAIAQISSFLRLLSIKYKADRDDNLKL